MGPYEELKSLRSEPVSIIHGTDWWTDCDDIAALRILLRAHKAGIARLLGIGINSVMEASAPSVSAFCCAEGPEIPVGVDISAVRDGENCRYQAVLAAYPHKIKSNAECPEAWRLYRRLLAEAAGPVEITDVGFPQIIMELLKSGPDEFSPLSGTELVKEKVRHVWLMAGRWDMPRGKEYNLSAYPVCSEAGDYLCRNCPVPITFLGFEAGMDVICGNELSHDDILYKAFAAHGSANGRSSWDPLTVLLAIIGDPAAAGYDTVAGFARVDPKTGENDFTPDPAGPHRYVVMRHPPAWYAERLNALIN